MSIYGIAVTAWIVGAFALVTTGLSSTDVAALLQLVLHAFERACSAAPTLNGSMYIGLLMCCVYMDYRVIRRVESHG